MFLATSRIPTSIYISLLFKHDCYSISTQLANALLFQPQGRRLSDKGMRPRSHSNSAKLGKERAEKCEAKRKQKRREFKCCGKPLDLGSRQDFCYLHETEFDCELLSSSSSSSFSSLFNPLFYETLFYDSDNFNRARFHHTEYILNAEENINSTRSFSLFYFSFFLLLRYLLTSSPNATRRFLLKIMLAGFKNMSFCSTQKYIVLFARNCTPTLYIYSTTCLIKQPVKKIINSKFYSDESSLLIFVLNSSQYFFFFLFFLHLYAKGY